MLLQNQAVGVPIEFTQGETPTLFLLATTDQGIPYNLTGAVLTTQILGYNINGALTLPSIQHTVGDQSTNPGTFTLALTSSNTEACGPGPNKEIITQAVIGLNVVVFRAESILTVFSETPVQ
jgi:hypothetical protein